MTDQVIIFDTTLRDGEQALKASLTVKEKLQIALALERLGVDVMEVGFPVSSAGILNLSEPLHNRLKIVAFVPYLVRWIKTLMWLRKL